MKQIRPLHFQRYIRANNPGARWQLRYGCSYYETADRSFAIYKEAHHWRVKRFNVRPEDTTLMKAVYDSGMTKVYFPQRIDAVEALEAIVQAEEST